MLSAHRQIALRRLLPEIGDIILFDDGADGGFRFAHLRLGAGQVIILCDRGETMTVRCCRVRDGRVSYERIDPDLLQRLQKFFAPLVVRS